MAHNLSALRVECGFCCHSQRPPTSFCRQLVQATSPNRRAKWSALLPGRPCPLYTTIFHAATKDRIAGERMRSFLLLTSSVPCPFATNIELVLQKDYSPLVTSVCAAFLYIKRVFKCKLSQRAPSLHANQRFDHLSVARSGVAERMGRQKALTTAAVEEVTLELPLICLFLWTACRCGSFQILHLPPKDRAGGMTNSSRFIGPFTSSLSTTLPQPGNPGCPQPDWSSWNATKAEHSGSSPVSSKQLLLRPSDWRRES